MSKAEPSGRSWKRLARRLAIGFLLPLVLVAVVYFALPAYLNSEANRERMLGQANAVLAPARLSFDRIQFSWWSPTRLEGFALTSKEGKRVVHAAKAVWERTLGQILLDRNRLGTLKLPDADLDVTRSKEGAIDLQEVLQPLLVEDAKRSLSIEMLNSRLRFRSSPDAVPFDANLARLDFKIGPAPNPTTWHLALAREATQTLDMDGSLDTWRRDAQGSIPLDLRVKAANWPLRFDGEDRLVLAGSLDGEIQAARNGGLWKVDGDARLAGLEASGGFLGGDRPRLDHFSLVARVHQTSNGWNISKLEVDSDVGIVRGRAVADLRDPGDLDLTATVDVGALAEKLPETLGRAEGFPLDGAKLVLKASSKTGLEAPGVDIEARWTSIDPKAAPGTTQLADESVIKARLSHPSAERWELLPLSLATPLGHVEARGSLDHDSQLKGWNYRAEGSIEPDWNLLAGKLRESVDPKAELVGKPSTFKVEGLWANAENSRVNAELRMGLERVDVFGLQVGETQAVIKLDDGKPTVDPIDMTINEGKVHLEPSFERDPSTQDWAVRLGKESFIAGIVVNDVVSKRFLAYVAPILESATRVSGKVSASIEEAVFPITDDPSSEPVIRGGIQFEELTFLPGPLASELLSMAGRSEQAGIRLNQPVSLSIADRRVVQKGLAIPIGNLSKVSLEGSVDFDKNLDLVATIPLPTALSGGRPVLGDIIGGTSVTIPIKGTLDKPRIDKDALNLALKDLGGTLLTKGIMRGASELLTRMITPRDPNAPPPPPRQSAEERKAQRLQRQAERRKRRGLEP